MNAAAGGIVGNFFGPLFVYIVADDAERHPAGRLMFSFRDQRARSFTDEAAPVTLEPMEYTVVVHKSKHGYDIHCPALPGCHSQGETEKEALANIKDAIKTHLAMVRKETRGLRTRRVLIPA